MTNKPNYRRSKGVHTPASNRKQKPSALVPIPQYIPSPYNFVPFNSLVITPEWAQHVSQDVPYSDSCSGTIQVQVVAETDIYVRNGGIHPEDVVKRNNEPSYRSFFKLTPSGSYAIPGTSFKGMLRNLIEIITFSKASYVDDRRFAVRDLQNPFIYSSALTQKVQLNGKEAWRPRAKAGFLIIEGDHMENWRLIPCDYCRIHHADLFKVYGWKFNRHEQIGGKQKEERWSAPHKYKLWEEKHNSLEISFTPGNEQLHKGIFLYKDALEVGTGKTVGTVVFTGQPSERKSKEFVFFNERHNAAIAVDHNLRRSFIQAHTTDQGPNREWLFWYERVRKTPHTKIPVFYLEDASGKPTSMGLCLMYRLAYKYTVHDCLKNSCMDHLTNQKTDFAELLFGSVSDDNSLGGRVIVEPLVVKDSPPQAPLVQTILNSPKPSYYPNYLKQNCDPVGHVPTKVPPGQKRPKGFYKTYMDRDAELSGWKRYPVRQIPKPTPPAAGQENVATAFVPLRAGSTFEGAIHLHNLTNIEVGALWWALTWGGNDKLRHNIGMAKPYGYGCIKVTALPNISDIKGHNCDVHQCMKLFVDYMERHVPGWNNSSQLCELRAMADPNFTPLMELRYPNIGTSPKTNEFIRFKDCDPDHKVTPKALVRFSTRIETAQNSTLPNARSFSERSTKSVGSVVECEVMATKTKTDKWRFRIVNGSSADCGVLTPTSRKPIPDDIAPGKKYKMIIKVASPNNFQFDWSD